MNLKTKIAAAAGLAVVPLGIATGFAGSAQAVTPVTATAVTHLTQRPDSGYSGNWALDNMIRTVTVTLTGPDAAKPGMFAYTGTVTDTGTAFATTGAKSPGVSGDPVQGSPSAAVAGSATIAFDSSSDAPDAKLVPASLAGAGSTEQSTTNWAEQFFPAGTTFGTGPTLPTWSWKYTDSKDCQKWTDAYNVKQADSGDITGTDSCTVSAAPVGNQAVTIGQPASIQVFGSTTSSDQALSYKASGLPDGLSIDPSTGLVSGTPKADAASGTVNVTVTDFGGKQAGTSFGITVKAATAVAPPPPAAVVLSAGYVAAGTLLPTRADVVWTATPHAAQYKVMINGPYFRNVANTVKVTSAFYKGLAHGHNYTVYITPENANGSTAGATGHVTFKTP